MTRFVRGVFLGEALITLGAGLHGLLDPTAFALQFVPEAPVGPALHFIRWLMATYLVISVLELGLLWRGTREAWVLVLAALLVGDVLHMGSHAMMLADGGLVGLPTAASFGLSVLFATTRLLVLWRPERVLRPHS
jgi:hypothetical protein